MVYSIGAYNTMSSPYLISSWRPQIIRIFLVLILSLTGSALLPFATGSTAETQVDMTKAYLGMWDYRGSQVHFTFVLKADSTGHLADEVDTFPFTYSLNTDQDPALLNLNYKVDMAFGRISHSLVRLERTEEGDLLHWVSFHSEMGPPEWPEAPSETPPGVTWITFQRIKP